MTMRTCLILIAYLALVACDETDDGESNPDAGGDTDSGEECPDPSVDDYQFQELFECPTCIDEPKDVLVYQGHGYSAPSSEFIGVIWPLAAEWLDADCIESCVTTPPQTVCQEASCVGSNGATIEYSYIREEVTTVQNSFSAES